jgi:hypothetical protein
MERLECHVKEYAWGKSGSDSEVARLFAAGHKDFLIGQNTPYAEVLLDFKISIKKLNHKIFSFGWAHIQTAQLEFDQLLIS